MIRESLSGHFGASLSPEEYMEHRNLLEAIRAGNPADASAYASQISRGD